MVYILLTSAGFLKLVQYITLIKILCLTIFITGAANYISTMILGHGLLRSYLSSLGSSSHLDSLGSFCYGPSNASVPITKARHARATGTG